MKIFLIILGVLIVIGLISWLIDFIKEHFLAVLTVLFIVLGIFVSPIFFVIDIIMWIVLLILAGVANYIERVNKEKDIENNKRLLQQQSSVYSVDELDEYLSELSTMIYSSTNKVNYRFDRNNMPYGRANAFLNYFGHSIYDDEPYVFLCNRSSIDEDFREYGILVSRTGIYYAKEIQGQAIDYEINFKALKGIEQDGTRLKAKIIDMKSMQTVEQTMWFDSVNVCRAVLEMCQSIISSGIGLALAKGNVVSSAQILQMAEDKEKEYNTNKVIADSAKISEVAAIGTSNQNFNQMYAETKNLMNGSRGNGYAAEYGNNTIDRMLFKKVESTAQILDETGRQVRYGADRTVNNVEIQTKYYQTASESIGAAFENKQAVYIRQDGTGKMMPIEVPRDQYNQALELMQKRIDSGQVPNVAPGESAKDYVKKGYFTYEQSWNIAKSGTVESVTVDLVSGVVCSSAAVGISAILVYARCIWRGKTPQEAFGESLKSAVQTLGKSVFIYTFTMQLSREQFANYFVKQTSIDGKIARGFVGMDNLAFKLSENISKQIKNSTMAKTAIGKSIGMDKLTGKQLVSGTVTFAMVFGPDVVKSIQGKISGKQLLKNSAVGAASIAGVGIGQALIPIPIVGGMIGGSIGGFFAKKTLDNYIEDDSKQMFRILKEEFIDQTMMSELTGAEFDIVVDSTVGNQKLQAMLQNMYRSGEYREYARDAIMKPAIEAVISLRPKIDEETYNNVMIKYVDGVA